MFTSKILLTVLLASLRLSEEVKVNPKSFANFKAFVYQPDEDEKIGFDAYVPGKGTVKAKVQMDNQLTTFIHIIEYPPAQGIIGYIEREKSDPTQIDYFAYASPFLPVVLSRTVLPVKYLNDQQGEYLVSVANGDYLDNPLEVFQKLDELKNTEDNEQGLIMNETKLISQVSSTGFFEVHVLDINKDTMESWLSRMSGDTLACADPDSLDLGSEEDTDPSLYVSMATEGVFELMDKLLNGSYTTAMARFEIECSQGLYSPEQISEKVGHISAGLKQYFFDELKNKFTLDSHQNYEEYSTMAAVVSEKVQGSETWNKAFTIAKNELEGMIKSGVPITFALYTYSRYKFGESPQKFEANFGSLLAYFEDFLKTMDGLKVADSKGILLNELIVLTVKCLTVVFTPLGSMNFMDNQVGSLGLLLNDKGGSIIDAKFAEAFDNSGANWVQWSGPFTRRMKNFLYMTRMFTPRMFSYINNFVSELIVPMVDQLYEAGIDSLSKKDHQERDVFDRDALSRTLFVIDKDTWNTRKEYYVLGVSPLASLKNRLLI